MTAQLVQVAKLDAADTYLGLEMLPADQITADHVQLPDGCDLPPGKYYWDRSASTFLPLRSPQAVAEESPLALNALAWMLLAMWSENRVPIPSASLRWLDFYVKTIDFCIPDNQPSERNILAQYILARNLK